MRHLQIQRITLVSQLVGLVLLSAGSAHAFTNVTTCGQKLAAPGEYILTSDLTCTGSFGNGIEIAANDVVLHLAGHTIASTDCDANRGISGILVGSGFSGIKIEGGTIRGFNDGIALASSSSRISGIIVASACIFGIALSGAGNQVESSVVTLSGVDGIGIGAASKTVIRYNDISDNARVGVGISNFSNDNVVEHNIINRNGVVDHEQGGVAIFNGTNNLIANNVLNNNFNGIEVESPGNLVRGNMVNGSVNTGIFIVSLGAPGTVKYNTILGSGFVDLSDDSSTCGLNTWKGNVFQTDFAGLASDGGPGAGCIR